VASEVDGKPKPTAQRNFTDAESCIMVKDGAYIQAYNAQVIVDAAHQVIIAHGVSNQPPCRLTRCGYRNRRGMPN
jgi:hypothetical protein